MNDYLENLKFNQNQKLSELAKKARENKVPIITPDTQETILAIMEAHNANKILEIGTAVAYSALTFVNNYPKRFIDTIERDVKMQDEALKNIKEFQCEEQVCLHCNDALTISIDELANDYDILFIDAAKAQSIKFFEKFSPLVKEDGIIITDNILFHGCVASPEGLSKNLSHMVKKIDEYNQYLSNLKDYHTYFIDCGDGLAITMRNKICN